MHKFEILSSRIDHGRVSVDVSYRETIRDTKSLESVLDQVAADFQVKRSNDGTRDSRRQAFGTLLTEMLRFADDQRFVASPESESSRHWRAFGKSVIDQMNDIVGEHGRRRVFTSRFGKTEDPDGLLIALGKALRKAGR